MLTPLRLSFGISSPGDLHLRCLRDLVARYCRSIQSPWGGVPGANQRRRRYLPCQAAREPPNRLWQHCCRIAQTAIRRIALPLNWNTIILARKVDTSPVGVRPTAELSCRRKRLSCTGRGESMPNLNINGRNMSVEAAADTPLLWAIREQLQMTGTKFGCGAGLCGACTVHVNGEAVRSCQTSLSDVAGKKITTIEGLSAKNDHPLQKAWIAEQVPQCGYCQSGQIMQAAALLAKNANPTKEEVVAHMDGNLCRCMTYSRIQKAIMRAASEIRTASSAATERRET